MRLKLNLCTIFNNNTINVNPKLFIIIKKNILCDMYLYYHYEY